MRVAAAVVAATPALADAPETKTTPDWLTLRGEVRGRAETLDGQFRAGGSGGDQLLALRSLLFAEADLGPAAIGVELQDSRTYLDDEGTPISRSLINPLDILQAYVRFDAPGLLRGDSRTDVKLGRQTVSIGSKRQIERVDFANVIRSYTGFNAISTNDRGDELHVVYVSPTARLPNNREDLDDNALSGDEEEWNRRIWAVHYRRADIAPNIAPGLWGEAFVYGLNERDTASVPTPNRDYLAPGFRLYRKPAIRQWDVDLEGALRLGSRRATSSPDDTEDLDVNASMLFAALGYTFDAPWSPRFAFEYYWASGDEDPNDGNFNQHERLFGARRSDLNNTSFHGPLTPANLNAPGFRIEVKPAPRWDARLYYAAAYLASDTDAFVIARLRDPTGASGDFMGHTLDSRARYWLVPDTLRLEIGASAFFFGDFTKTAPNAPTSDRTLYGYTQLTWSF